MLKQVFSYTTSHRVEHKINTFPPCLFCGRNEITVTGNKHNLINLFFVCERCNINSYFHINAFLLGTKQKISLSQ